MSIALTIVYETTRVHFFNKNVGDNYFPQIHKLDLLNCYPLL